MKDPAHLLFWDTSFVDPEGVTAELVPFPGSANVAGWKLTRPIDVPDRIYFEANVETVRQVDYPDNNVNWPIMSRRMRGVLLPGAPRHRVISIIMLDDTVPTADRFVEDRPRPGVAVEGFAAVQLLERTDAMDMERSVYTLDEDIPGCARDVQKLVLKDMPLPPLFRLAAYPSPLFVSSAAREHLERAAIKGITLLPLDAIAVL